MLRADQLELRVADRRLCAGSSFELEVGRVLTITGVTGCGKSTLLRALAWLHPLRGGQLTWHEKTPHDWGICEWRRRITYVPQLPPLLLPDAHSFCVRLSHLGVHRSNPARGVFLDHSQMHASAWGLPGTAWQADPTTLSGGERQRLYLAIVLATEPDVLLLDEPTSALDLETKLAVERSLHGRTCIWVTHDQEQAARVATERLNFEDL